eukprot:scaffold297987_cov13-Tisochrysis_lutea.AAC.1
MAEVLYVIYHWRVVGYGNTVVKTRVHAAANLECTPQLISLYPSQRQEGLKQTVRVYVCWHSSRITSIKASDGIHATSHCCDEWSRGSCQVAAFPWSFYSEGKK